MFRVPRMRDDTAEVLKAIAQPDRLRLLEAFASHEQLSPTQAQPIVDMPLGNISYHVRLLAKAGLLAEAGTEPRRGAVEHFYRVTPTGRAGLAAARKLDHDLR